MPTPRIASEFDEISRVYDETREPLDAATFDGLVSLFRRAGIASVLEVGVGTGRIAGPLATRSLTVTGVDVSAGMLARARSKGVPRLVRASGYHLPFADRAFDATLFVHVIHLLDDPVAALREATRVGEAGAFALVHPTPPGPGPGRGHPFTARRLLREALNEQGCRLPHGLSDPWTKEREILSRLPPHDVEVVSDRPITKSVRADLDRLARGGNRNLLAIPPPALEKALEVARARAGEETVTYRQVEAVARWTADSLPPPQDRRPAAPPDGPSSSHGERRSGPGPA